MTRAFLVSFLAAMCLSKAAAAQTPPIISVSGSAGVYVEGQPSPSQDVTIGNHNAFSSVGGAVATAKYSVAAAPQVSATASTEANTYFQDVEGEVELKYYFKAVPDANAKPNEPVEMNIQGTLAVHVTGPSEGNTATADLEVILNGPQAQISVSSAFSPDSDSQVVDQDFTVNPKYNNYVYLYVDATATKSSGDTDSGSATASIDPTLTLTGPDAQDYTLIFSPGINADAAQGISSVPEPSTWAMMLAGFAGLSLLGYRKTAKGPLAA
jgi:PEP-CTERM motif